MEENCLIDVEEEAIAEEENVDVDDNDEGEERR
jgi:hypothetical protein